MTAPPTTTYPGPPRPVPPPGPPPPNRPGGELTSAQWSMTVTPVVAAVTTLCASLALSGVIEGLRWWGYAGVAVTVVTAVGLGLRAARTPILLVGFGQMFALLCLLVALFTDSGILGIFPGPAAIGELSEVLANSVEVVRTGVPPVAATQAVLCLVVIAIGLVSILVDTLAVSAGTPAACGLVLLCVYAVPASLADEMLPWWAFVLGAVSFALLLWVDGAHRHQVWRNRPMVQGTSGGFGSPTVLVSTSIVVALFVGATATFVGTVGQLPGGSGGGSGGGLGLNPFTSLRGMLDHQGNVELFRVRNLGDDPRYLRALTLPEYDENGGWLLREENQLPLGHPTDRELPPPPGRDNFGGSEIVEIEIEPINSEDVWAPVVGTPVRMRDLPDGMRYDPESGMIYGEQARTLPRYVEVADMSEPTADQLRSTGSFYAGGDIDDVYTDNDGIDDEVTQLANDLIAGQGSMYDRVLAIMAYFDIENGFSYETQTASGADEDALREFLFESKAGYCEQYASSMAILLRAAGIPSRVAMGYTAGYPSGDYRTITTQNAHAWVEVFFPDFGWVMFDPTPLADGTNYTPPYADETGSTGPVDPTDTPSDTAAPTTPVAPTENPDDEEQAGAAADGGQRFGGSDDSWLYWTIGAIAAAAMALTALGWSHPGAGGGVRRARGRPALLLAAGGAWTAVVVLLAAVVSWWLAALVLLVVLAGAPGLVRERRRIARRHDVHGYGPGAASSAWAELLAESRDRGGQAVETETVRTAAKRLAREHELDQEGRRALRTVVGEVERSWYGGRAQPDPTLAPAFDQLIAGLRRSDPLHWRARLFPRSVLRRS